MFWKGLGRNFPGNFLDVSRKIPEKIRENSAKIPASPKGFSFCWAAQTEVGNPTRITEQIREKPRTSLFSIVFLFTFLLFFLIIFSFLVGTGIKERCPFAISSF